MHYRKQLYLLLTSIALVAGCGSGMQRGQYVVGASHGERLANGGWISKFRGTPSNDVTAPDQLLAAFIFVGPGFDTGAESHLTYLSSLHVKTPPDNFTIEWDRSSEIVKIDRAEYDRADGNIFVVRMDGADISSYQVETIIHSEVTVDILAAVKNARPHDAEAQALASRASH